MPRTRPESPEGHVLTSAMRCLLGGEAGEERRGGHLSPFDMCYIVQPMNGPIAQAVALVCHANAALRGTDVTGFFPSNSTCKFCDRVSFVVMNKPFWGTPKEVVVADDPAAWFETLRRQGYRALGLHHHANTRGDIRLSDRLSAGFVGGGGTWLLEVIGNSVRSELWAARWEVWDQNAPGQRIWRVTYGLVGDMHASTAPAARDLDEVQRNLTTALADIFRFSQAHDTGGFSACFDTALRILETGKSENVYHTDLAPPGVLTDSASALLAACQKAWVFGGMGSWNDMGFEGDAQRDYERVSVNLFRTLNAAIAVSASTSARLT